MSYRRVSSIDHPCIPHVIGEEIVCFVKQVREIFLRDDL